MIRKVKLSLLDIRNPNCRLTLKTNTEIINILSNKCFNLIRSSSLWMASLLQTQLTIWLLHCLLSITRSKQQHANTIHTKLNILNLLSEEKTFKNCMFYFHCIENRRIATQFIIGLVRCLLSFSGINQYNRNLNLTARPDTSED